MKTCEGCWEAACSGCLLTSSELSELGVGEEYALSEEEVAQAEYGLRTQKTTCVVVFGDYTVEVAA